MLLFKIFLILSCTVGVLLAQAFQYSVPKDWRNGKRTLGMSARDAACQLQKLKNIIEGKNSNQLYWPCNWQNLPSAYDVELRPHGNQGPQPMASSAVIDEGGNL